MSAPKALHRDLRKAIDPYHWEWWDDGYCSFDDEDDWSYDWCFRCNQERWRHYVCAGRDGVCGSFVVLSWVMPSVCDPPHGVSHPDHAVELANAFARSGWDKTKPALVGYPWLGGRIQLLSGSHRWIGASMANIAIPVVVVEFAEVEAAWGDVEKWQRLMKLGDGVLCRE